MHLVTGRLHVVDAKTFASEGRNAGKILLVFYDECGRTVRYCREEFDWGVGAGALIHQEMDDISHWETARIGPAYRPGGPLGPRESSDEVSD
ncbi:hypothetical protein N7468_006192 [Penicillium chermesinum]|uniref:Uncharacterized protein n=1 Tax=Penicillium chermesinum TaxID=63820 RepID=A0A9W9NRR4_9EURO|nr:uncharacterized protein N7468_006192 [Penicillium chermesinum]KAJ5224967.1 hypothetical protein N7468_006192 [Penicillium chermesinum]